MLYLLVLLELFREIEDFIDFKSLTTHSPSREEREEDPQSDPEEDPQSDPDERRFVAIRIPTQSLHNVPYGIITEKQWSAFTFYIRVENRNKKLAVESVVDTMPTDPAVEVIELNDVSVLTIAYDTHWNCYCKTEDVCSCGCDPLHNGW